MTMSYDGASLKYNGAHFFMAVGIKERLKFKLFPFPAYNSTTTIQPVICQSYKKSHFANVAVLKT